MCACCIAMLTAPPDGIWRLLAASTYYDCFETFLTDRLTGSASYFVKTYTRMPTTLIAARCYAYPSVSKPLCLSVTFVYSRTVWLPMWKNWFMYVSPPWTCMVSVRSSVSRPLCLSVTFVYSRTVWLPMWKNSEDTILVLTEFTNVTDRYTDT